MSISSAVYDFARRTFWLMPAVLRNRLHGFRHTLVRWFRRSANRGHYSPGDLNWSEFSRGPLARSSSQLVFIFEANLDWSITLYQRPHHLALALGRHGCLVLYKTTGDGVLGFRPINDNVWLVNDSNLEKQTGVIRCFYSTSLFATREQLLQARRSGIAIYEYIDHIDASISGGRANLRRLQELKEAAFEHADLVVSSAKVLFDEANQHCKEKRSVSIPNAVDITHFDNENLKTTDIGSGLLEFREKYSDVIGYFGAIAPWLWYDLIDQVCALLPEKGFVFIGPDYSGCVPHLPDRENFLYLGPIDYRKLPAHAALFDICFIPFIKGDIARSTSPLKLFEYFALEKPVVVTSDMEECTAFEEVFSGDNAKDIADCIVAALAQREDPDFKARLRSLAEANSWDVRARTYISKIVSLRHQPAQDSK